jgi:RHS repeat-associated protein
VTSNYTYDPLYELTQVTQATNTTESYSYDPVGNRLSSLGVSPYGDNTSNELTSTPTANYAYDYNGNLSSETVSGSTTQYSWDYENRLISVALPGTGGTVTFKYDSFGRRIQKAFTQNSTTTTTNYLYDGANSIEDVDQSGNVLARYEQTTNIDEPLAVLRSATTSYYHADGLGSVTSLSSSTGTLANTYTYDSFGNLIASTGSLANRFEYTGREFDAETHLYFYRARFYDSTIGRFVSEDPLGFRGGTSFYKYAADNPTNLTDPRGLRPGSGTAYYDCLQTCLHDTLNCNLRQLGKNLAWTAAGGPAVGVGVCGAIVIFEPYLAPGFFPCVGVTTVSTWAVAGSTSVAAWNIRNVSSTLGCTTFCGLNTW